MNNLFDFVQVSAANHCVTSMPERKKIMQVCRETKKNVVKSRLGIVLMYHIEKVYLDKTGRKH